MSNKLPDTPWWISDYQPTQVKESKPQRGITFLAIVMAIIAGIIGSFIGRASSNLHTQTNLVSSKATIERAPDSIAGIAARVSPSVVSINVSTGSTGDTGSGFFLSSSGYILTNNHVVSAAANGGGNIRVALANNKSYPARLVGRDSSYDLAVLKIDVTDAPALQLGNSDEIQVGDGVIAIGSPLGLAGTVTSGIISAKNRAVSSGSGTGESSFINALQTDAAINPGNSGGPLVDMSGAVIGVNSAIASLGSGFGGQSGSIGLGFAIPINQAKKTADQLIKTGTATYPIMGISLTSNYQGAGALVASVTAGYPGAKAGIKQGDVITAIDSKPVSNSDEAIVLVRSHNVGDVIKVKFERSGVSKEVSLTLVAAKD
jgi:putative serine protease PepD